MKPKNKKKRRKALSPKTKRLITALGIVVGLSAGFCYWWFVSRCMKDDCFYHYVPMGELFVGIFAGWMIPVSLLNLKENRLFK
ncbi:MAG: hypothetical protein GXX03_00065 [Bacteroidales bacterium]|nr:hypothetical protein [Bacteroidales bacterium]